MPRQRPADAIRPVTIDPGFLDGSASSVLYASGRTSVLCVATIAPGVPAWLEGSGRGWATAEYDLLPGATTPRKPRERAGKLSGRTQEIQRLIGRSLRAVLDLERLDGATLTVDCDVLRADGGTRTGAISGAYVAARLAVRDALARGQIDADPFLRAVAAVSVGIVDGRPCLDLDYEEDASAAVDLNVVVDDTGGFLEIQGTAERAPFSRDQLGELLDLAAIGTREIFAAQTACLAKDRRVGE